MTYGNYSAVLHISVLEFLKRIAFCLHGFYYGEKSHIGTDVHYKYWLWRWWWCLVGRNAYVMKRYVDRPAKLDSCTNCDYWLKVALYEDLLVLLVWWKVLSYYKISQPRRRSSCVNILLTHDVLNFCNDFMLIHPVLLYRNENYISRTVTQLFLIFVNILQILKELLCL